MKNRPHLNKESVYRSLGCQLAVVGFAARLHAAGTPHPGIAYCGKDTKSIGTIIQGLVLIWEVLELEEMANRVEFL